MTDFQVLDRALAARGWRYDATGQQFEGSTGALHLERIRALVPGMTIDDLAEYQDDQYTQHCKRRVRPM